MLNRILSKIAGDYNQKEINRISQTVQKINTKYEEFNWLTDQEIKNKTDEFKTRLTKWETLDDILPEAFATVKQACKRMVWQKYDVKGEEVERNMIPYDVQLVWGIALHEWQISEMKTWEGKTLVAVLPVYLNALEWKGVHVVTVNDYLASRDAARMAHVYNRLGMSVGCVVKWVHPSKRRAEYEKDITYVENSELGFDYLRDNLVKSMEARSLLRRPLNYAIVDEIDSILIDEARTPLIISEPKAEPTEKYTHYARIVKSLSPCTNKKSVSKGLLSELMKDAKWEKKQEEDGDYYIDEKTKTASLSWRGIAKLEQMLKVENLYKDIWYEEIHHIENALKAQAVYNKDKEYLVKDWEVMIVDEHTGRTMPGRRFSEGLHQAIEAKENVKIQRESKTMATITYQNFFKQFNKLSWMTGTAVTEGEEFNKIYELSVLEIPTNKPIIRVDKNDKVFFNQTAKRKFVRDYIEFYHEIGQPILIGTYSVLNAKFFEQEANIISNAWKFWSVVVATNMAWRGTDIKLDKTLNPKLANNYAKRIKKQLQNWNNVSAVVYSNIEFELTLDWIKNIFELDDQQIRQAEKSSIKTKDWTINIKFNNKKSKANEAFAEIIFQNSENQETIQKDFHYWLFILWTEKHESRRIDNQLRGRAGRQWDPGISIFFVALDDLIMRKMWWERIQQMAGVLMKKEELEQMELSQKQFTNSIIKAQEQMEWRHFSIRKHLFDYDNVINKQRQRIYWTRDEIIFSEMEEEKKKKYLIHAKQQILDNIEIIIKKQIETAKTVKQNITDFLDTIQKEMNFTFKTETITELQQLNYQTLWKELIKQFQTRFVEQTKNIDDKTFYKVLKDVNLHYIDTLRVNHIDEMQYLREKVGLMGYAQMDPLIVYKTN